MILTPAEMIALEQSAFDDGVSAEALMDDAGAQMAAAIQQFCPTPGECAAVFGKGHNGGDALVAARHLASAGWKVHVVPAFPRDQWAPLTRRKFEEAGLARQHWPGALPTLQRRPAIILDGMLGTGATGALRGPIMELCRKINAVRQSAPALVFALDLPTGLDGNTGVASEDAIVADATLSVGAAKTGLVMDQATPYVGRLAVLPLAELTARMQADAGHATVATPAELQRLLPRRKFDSHKGDYGRIGIVAGSRGLVGAAVLSA
ncbi:MAG: NAD(P)H-hydrate epimerase, partial [Chthoniobacteraceae bacterium]